MKLNMTTAPAFAPLVTKSGVYHGVWLMKST
jgi:hypothetical protein